MHHTGHHFGNQIFITNSAVKYGWQSNTIKGIMVNDVVLSNLEGMTAIVIYFEELEIEREAKGHIKIWHFPDVKPKVIHPIAMKPPCTCALIAIALDSLGKFSWTANQEDDRLDFSIWQKRWGRPQEVAVVSSKGNGGPNAYQANVLLHTWENTYQVREIGQDSTCFSDSVQVLVAGESPTQFYNTKRQIITFSHETSYEL
jgi:hypothetical protein